MSLGISPRYFACIKEVQNILIFKIYIYIIFFFMLIYCIQRNICPNFIFAPFAFVVSGRTKDLANFNVKTLYGRIQDGMKSFASKTIENNTG